MLRQTTAGIIDLDQFERQFPWPPDDLTARLARCRKLTQRRGDSLCLASRTGESNVRLWPKGRRRSRSCGLPFAEAARGQGREREKAVKVTDALLGEHGVLYAHFDRIEAVAAVATRLTQIQEASVVLSAVVRSHANLEEEVLFPALEAHMGPTGPLAVMRTEHDEIEDALQQIQEARDLDDGVDRVARALSIVRSHFQKEEEVLFSMARQMLDEETQIRLGKAWAEARRVTIA